MFRTKLTLVSVAVAATVAAATPVAQADPARHTHDYFKTQSRAVGHDTWYGYAVSLTQAQQSVPFITDTLAPGGTASEYHRWFLIEHPLAAAQQPQSYRFITDTLAPGGGASSVVSVPADTGFSWADASIGALVACGLMLLALMGRQLAGRRRRGGQLAF